MVRDTQLCRCYRDERNRRCTACLASRPILYLFSLVSLPLSSFFSLFLSLGLSVRVSGHWLAIYPFVVRMAGWIRVKKSVTFVLLTDVCYSNFDIGFLRMTNGLRPSRFHKDLPSFNSEKGNVCRRKHDETFCGTRSINTKRRSFRIYFWLCSVENQQRSKRHAPLESRTNFFAFSC